MPAELTPSYRHLRTWSKQQRPASSNRWLATPLGSLCLIIVLDQFPRGLFAGTRKDFAFDPLALTVAEEGLRNGHYDALVHSWEKVFFALPLIHAEGPDHFDGLIEALPWLSGGLRKVLQISILSGDFGLSQARGHRDVIARFGRHPHRNRALGRPSTRKK